MTGAADRRRHALEVELHAATAQMGEALAAGRSFEEATGVAALGRGGLARELAVLADDLRHGVAYEDALRRFRDRVGHEDVDFLVAALVLQRQAGGSLASLMDGISLTLRERLRVRDLMRTLTSQGRISAWLLGGLPIFLFFYMLLMSPDYVSRLWTFASFPFNLLPLVIALVAWTAGFLWIQQVVTIDMFGPVPEPLLPSRADWARRERMSRQMPQVLDLLVVAVEAGHSFESALQQVVRVFSGPLVEELRGVLERSMHGTPVEKALREMSDRVHVAEVEDLVTTVLTSRQLGTPLAQALKVQAHEQRRRRSQRAEEEARKAGVKIILPLAFCIFPVLLLLILGPAVLGMISVFEKLPK